MTTLKAEQGETFEGKYDLTFGSDRVTGTFNAEYCEIPHQSQPTSCD